MGMGHRLAPSAASRCTAVAQAPYVPPQLSTSSLPLVRACHGLRRQFVRDAGDLAGPQIDHVLVILRVVADVAGDVLLFQSADAVHQARRARNGPGPGQPLVAGVGLERMSIGRRAGMLDRNERQFVDGRNLPGLGAVGDVAVAEQDDGRHVARGDAPGFLGHVKTIGRAAGGDHRQRTLAVAAEQGLEQVGLFGLGGQVRCWARRAAR